MSGNYKGRHCKRRYFTPLGALLVSWWRYGSRSSKTGRLWYGHAYVCPICGWWHFTKKKASRGRHIRQPSPFLRRRALERSNGWVMV